MKNVYSKIPDRKANRDKHAEYLERKVKEYEVLVAKFGCYEDDKPITCLHCPYVLQGKECNCRFTELL